MLFPRGSEKYSVEASLRLEKRSEGWRSPSSGGPSWARHPAKRIEGLEQNLEVFMPLSCLEKEDSAWKQMGGGIKEERDERRGSGNKTYGRSC